MQDLRKNSYKKSRTNKGFGKIRTSAHTAQVVLALERRLLITRCLLFSCKTSVVYGIGALLRVLYWEHTAAEKTFVLILLNKKGELFSAMASKILIRLIEQSTLQTVFL